MEVGVVSSSLQRQQGNEQNWYECLDFQMRAGCAIIQWVKEGMQNEYCLRGERGSGGGAEGGE